MRKDYSTDKFTTKKSVEEMFICTDGAYIGKGNSVESSYKNYLENGGKVYYNCDFYKSEKVEVQLIIK